MEHGKNMVCFQFFPSLADAFAELRQLGQKSAYTLETPVRHNRDNALIKTLDDVSM